MAVNGNGARSRLVTPVATVVVCVFAAAAIRALWFGDVAVLVVACGPFTLLCGYLFGFRMIRE